MYPNHHAAARQRQRIQRHATDTDSYAFFNLLTGPQLLDEIEALLPEHREREFPPTETLSMFLAQVLSADGSCRQAVNDAALKRLVGGLSPCSSNTSAYCQARSRLPIELVSTLARQVGGLIAEASPYWWHWQGRRVRLVDGATVILADTEDNQAAYPQPSSQKPGLARPATATAPRAMMLAGIMPSSGTFTLRWKASRR